MNEKKGRPVEGILSGGKLHHEHEFLSAVLDTVDGLVVVLDATGRITHFNKACEQITKYTAEEVIDKLFWDVCLIPEEIESVKAVFKSLASGQFPNTHESYWVAKSGDLYLINWSTTALLNQDGEVEYVIGTGIDITRRKLAEEQLNNQLHGLEILTKAAAGFVELEPGEDIYQYMAEQISMLAGDAYVGVASFEEHDEQCLRFRLKAIMGPWKNAETDIDSLKNSLLNQSISINPEEKISRHKLTKYSGAIDGLLSGALSQDISHALEVNFGSRDIYTMEIRREEDLFGGVVLFTHPGTAPKNTDLVEMFINLASVALQRREAEAKVEFDAHRFSVLSQLGQIATASLNLDEVLHRVITEVQPLLGAEGIAVLLLDKPEELTFASVKGEGADILKGMNIPASAGVAGEVMQSRQAMIVNSDADQSRIYRVIDDTTGYQTRSLLAVPLLLKGEIIGVMEAVHQQPATFSYDDLFLLENVANWASIAIGNARQFTTIQHQLKESEAIANISRTLIEALDLDQVLQVIVDVAEQMIASSERAVIHLLEEENNNLNLAALAGVEPPEGPVFAIRPGEGIAGRVIQEGKTINVGNTKGDPRYLSLGAQTHTSSLLVAPIQSRQRLLGTISVRSSKPYAFSPDDERLLTNLGLQAAVAIEKANLFEAEQHARQTAETLYKITQRISESLEVDQILKQVAGLIHESFNCYCAQIYLIDEVSGELILKQRFGGEDAQVDSNRRRVPMGEGIVGHVALTSTPLVTDNVKEVSYYIPDPSTPTLHAEMAVPILIGDQLLGVIDIHHQSPNTFTDHDLRLANAIADQLAIGIEKATFYFVLQRALRQEQVMRTQLVQSEKLAALGRIIASVAHELNNPLQAIQNALYLVQSEDLPNPQTREDLQIALSETHRMAELIARLRETYRPATSEEFQPASLNEIIGEVGKLISTHMRHNNVILDFDPDQDMPPCPIIRDQIKQVLLNICLNAVETMPDGGILKITTRHQEKSRGVQVTISDTGPGIDPEVLPYIFDPFVTTKESGTGLGLAITYDIVRRHSGRIDVNSKPSKGTTFTVWLPLEQIHDRE